MQQTATLEEPVFFWQGLLIILPVVVLASVGLYSLRQDRILARHEAQVRAQTLSEDLAPKILAQLTAVTPTQSSHPSFKVNEFGRLISPAPLVQIPTPSPLNPAALSPDQARLWQSAQSASDNKSSSTATRALQEFIDSSPPNDFAAAALYSLGLTFAQEGQLQKAAEQFEKLVEKYPHALGESGLRFGPLARLRLLEFADRNPDSVKLKSPSSLDEFCLEIIEQPTALTPLLLDQIATQTNVMTQGVQVRKWQQLWSDNQAARQLFAAVAMANDQPEHAAIPNPALGQQFIRFSGPGRQFARGMAGGWKKTFPDRETEWFAIRYDFHSLPQTNSPPLISTNVSAREYSYVCKTDPELGAYVDTVVNNTSGVPDYFGVDLQIGGRSLTSLGHGLRLWRETSYFGRKGGGVKPEVTQEQASEVLASATVPGMDPQLFQVTIRLTSPSALYKQERARTFWFAALVSIASVSALAGLIAAWRAFHRQLQLSQMKTNFVSSVSHELRAPVASVRLMIENLEGGKVSEPGKQAEYFKFIGQETRRLSALIENLLDFSRIERGSKQYDLEATDPVALVNQTVQLMQPYAGERNVTLKLNDLPVWNSDILLHADGRALQQALINLIDNALKHSKNGQAVNVGLEHHNADAKSTDSGDPKPARVAIWVKDKGCGIPAEEHTRIFDRFYRLGSELRRETPGVGIGLSIVKHIVEAHGGKVIVRSAPGEGSRFTIELPLPRAPRKESIRAS